MCVRGRPVAARTNKTVVEMALEHATDRDRGHGEEEGVLAGAPHRRLPRGWPRSVPHFRGPAESGSPFQINPVLLD
jgi:hypothetical protein